MNESAVLTVVVLTPWQQNRSESAFLYYVRPHSRAYVPRALSQSAFNRPVRNVLGVPGTLGPLLSRRLDKILRRAPPYAVLDTVLVPLMRRCRGAGHPLLGTEATLGRGGKDKNGAGAPPL
jgi:hypothetical protein